MTAPTNMGYVARSHIQAHVTPAEFHALGASPDLIQAIVDNVGNASTLSDVARVLQRSESDISPSWALLVKYGVLVRAQKTSTLPGQPTSGETAGDSDPAFTVAYDWPHAPPGPNP